MVRNKPTKAKKEIDKKMPTIRVMRDTKDELYELAEKGETFGDVINRLIKHYKATKAQDK